MFALIPIWHALEKAVNEFKIAALENKVSLELDLSPLVKTSKEMESVRFSGLAGLPPEIRYCKVVGDNVRLAQVLRNLISNGLKFSKRDGSLTIRPSWKANDKGPQEKESTLHSGEVDTYMRAGDLQVEVIDTGAGMSKEQLKRLFTEGVQFNGKFLPVIQMRRSTLRDHPA